MFNLSLFAAVDLVGDRRTACRLSLCVCRDSSLSDTACFWPLFKSPNTLRLLFFKPCLRSCVTRARGLPKGVLGTSSSCAKRHRAAIGPKFLSFPQNKKRNTYFLAFMQHFF